jgi:glutamate racemase
LPGDRHGAAELVAAAEARLRGETPSSRSFAAVLDGLRGQPGGEAIDVIVSACTHFPLVEAELTVAAASGAPRRWRAGIARRSPF